MWSQITELEYLREEETVGGELIIWGGEGEGVRGAGGQLR